MLSAVTIDELLAFHPCADYPRARLVELYASRDRCTALDIFNFPIPLIHRMWAACQAAPEVDRSGVTEYIKGLVPDEYLSSVQNDKPWQALSILAFVHEYNGTDPSSDADQVDHYVRSVLEAM